MWTVENPKNSRMWDTKCFKWLARLKSNTDLNYERISFDMCMHGGSRPKATTFLVSEGLDFSSLALSCDDSHPHKAWGLVHEEGCVFATAEERNYPDVLCKRVAANACKEVQGSAYEEFRLRFTDLAKGQKQTETNKRLDELKLADLKGKSVQMKAIAWLLK